MRPMTRVLGAAFASSALVLGMTPLAFAAPAHQVGAIDWKPCAEAPAIDCGFLTLPIDYAEPDGEKFQLAVSRRKANDQSQRVGALVVNPGGPGSSGVDFSFSADQYFSKEIVDRFDVIGFDPRGVARSQPIKCSAEAVQRPHTDRPKTVAEYDQLVAYNRELGEDCRKQSGPIFDHASTKDVANDIDSIRRALGEKKISYYGVSYGTIMGQHYAEQYGKNIRAMIIDSNMDRSLGARKLLETEARGGEDVFNEWVKWNDRTPSSPFYGQDLRKIWKDLLAEAARGELKDPRGNVITPELLGVRFLNFSHVPAWKLFADYVVTLVHGASAPLKAFAEGETFEYPFQGIVCNDYNLRVASFAEYQVLSDVESRVAPNVVMVPFAHGAVTGCIGLPKATNPPHPLKIKNAPKILVTNAKYDPATVHEWAVNVHRQSRDTTVLVTYEGWGHGVYGRSDCTMKINDEYLVSLKLPNNGTTCAAVESPLRVMG
ncbi:alpha/beta hydrolase [Lentzea sp. PSKA42]|uniref:Alpha/beta hydrolase n=1 Tax=Lentzea indica TaxID=2604800 RepID=A0ABX1FW20_9PSEU|nr:alpha/beta hydrolase [Lentzea indica]NKE63105.1 alpha/beta hydrolase [Lentzea indica]